MVDETVPIGLFLVTSGSKGDRLLFRYPFIFDVNRENGIKGSKKSPYAILSDYKDDLRISQEEGLDPKECNLSGRQGNCWIKHWDNLAFVEDFFEGTNPHLHYMEWKTSHGWPDGKGTLTHDHWGYFTPALWFDDKLLSTLFGVKPGLCGQKLELKIENVRFIGHPTHLSHDSYRDSTISMFNVVFALRADASYSVVSCYHDLSHRLAVAIRNEESRCSYLTSQVKLMQSAHDEIASLPEDNEESPFQLILSRSELAVQLKMAFVDLKTNGMVRLKINGWIELSFCLPNKLQEEKLLIEPECIQACLKNLRPYHGLLLLTGAAELLSSLPEDSSPALIRLISVTSPLKNFQQLAADADIILTHVFQLVSHLLYWGKATIIYPLCDSNVYVISPHAPTYIHSPLVPKFSERFPNCSLLKILSKFSLPISLSGLHNPINSPYQQAQQVQMVIWMLQHRLLIQLHTYVYLIPSERSPACSNIHSFDLSYSDESGESHSKASSEDEDLSLREQDSIRQANLEPTDILRESSCSTNSKEDLKNFLRFCRYFRGQHHLEEIMYCENIRRSHLHSLLDKFRKILITCQFEDGAVFALNNRI